MGTPNLTTIASRVYWAYANLGMAEMAVHDGDERYTTKHFIIRARLFSGLNRGTMAPKSLMRDQKIRMKLPQECVYCGNQASLSIDHVWPTNRGGPDSGDNAVWACRKCNSSKSDRDLFEWWFCCNPGFPPLFAARVYLKHVIEYFTGMDLLDCDWAGVQDSPFRLECIPEEFPQPQNLIFTPFHARGKLNA
jgi:hypothetical protein